MANKKLSELTLEEVELLFNTANVSEEALDEFVSEFWRLFSEGK